MHETLLLWERERERNSTQFFLWIRHRNTQVMYEFGPGLMIYDRVITLELSKNKKFSLIFYLLSFKGCMYIYSWNCICNISYPQDVDRFGFWKFFFFSGGCFYFAKLGFLKFLMLLTIFGRFLCFLKPCYSVCFSCILKFRCEQAFPNVIHSWKDKQFIQPKNCCQRHLGSSELHVRPPSSGNTNSDLLVVWSDK